MSSSVEGGGWTDESSGLLFVEWQSQTGINLFIMLILCFPPKQQPVEREGPLELVATSDIEM